MSLKLRCTRLIRSLSFRQIAPFGSTAIRQFNHNVADMKKLAARDFEDILQVRPVYTRSHIHCFIYWSQCCIPCVEGLVPAPHNDSIADLLYIATYWHSLAKLRIHSDTTLNTLDNVTIIFARLLRNFAEVTCPCFNTVESDREYSARRRASDRRASRQQGNAASSIGEKRPKTFNLATYKLHALGDYVKTIKLFGTTDSYSTQIVRLKCAIWAVTDFKSHRASLSTAQSRGAMRTRTRTALLINW